MAESIYIPPQVQEEIADHLKHVVAETVEEYVSVAEDEDTLVGHFGSKLQTPARKVRVENVEVGGVWSWKFEYTKFRGRGGGATENLLGADGILRVQVDHQGRSQVKAALFQAKIEGTVDKQLLTQCAKLSTWREAAFVLDFLPRSIDVIGLDAVFRAATSKRRKLEGKDLGQFVVDDFLPCHVGDPDLQYDAVRKILTWRALDQQRSEGRLVGTRFRVRHRLGLQIRTPRRLAPPPRPLLGPEEIHDHRMWRTASEVLGVEYGFDHKAIKSRHRALATSYHPDLMGKFDVDPEVELMMRRRMQEFNTWAEELKQRIG